MTTLEISLSVTTLSRYSWTMASAVAPVVSRWRRSASGSRCRLCAASLAVPPDRRLDDHVGAAPFLLSAPAWDVAEQVRAVGHPARRRRPRCVSSAASPICGQRERSVLVSIPAPALSLTGAI
jgi:hypothetical protein